MQIVACNVLVLNKKHIASVWQWYNMVLFVWKQNIVHKHLPLHIPPEFC